MDLHQQLAEAKIALKDQQDCHTTMKAIAEHRAIEAGVNGKNEDERKRNFVVALAQDEAYCAELSTLRACEADVLRTEADLAASNDERSALRLQIQERQAAALERFADALCRVPPAVAAAAAGHEANTDEWFQR